MINAYNFTKKDEINAVSATPLQKVKGQVLNVKGAAITERVSEDTGEAIKVGLLAAEEGTYSSISGTAIKCLEMIIDYMNDLESDNGGEGVTVQVRVNCNKSNAGREFITLELM